MRIFHFGEEDLLRGPLYILRLQMLGILHLSRFKHFPFLTTVIDEQTPTARFEKIKRRLNISYFCPLLSCNNTKDVVRMMKNNLVFILRVMWYEMMSYYLDFRNWSCSSSSWCRPLNERQSPCG